MRFDSKFRGAARQRGTKADVKHGPMNFISDGCMGGIDPGGGKDKPSGVDVRSRKTKFMAKLIAADYRTGKRVTATQHLAGQIQFTITNGFADASAADDFAIQRDGGEAVDDEIQFLAQF